MKKYIWILSVFALIAELAFAQAESLKYEDEISGKLDEITEQLANKIESPSYELKPSKRGIKLENLKLTLN